MHTLNEFESRYHDEISKAIKGKDLTALLLVEVSLNLYNELKIEGIFDEEYNDVLLFQYGVYNWGDEHGRHFSLDITRQLQMPLEDEPYQLSFSLVFDPERFENIDAYDCWSMDFSDLESFIEHIKDTDGFRAAEKNVAKTYNIQFSQC